MADAETQITLDALQDAIEADIKAAFPDLATVEFDREDRTGLVLPAVLLDISELDADDDLERGTEQLAVSLRIEALVVIGAISTPRAKREGRKLAASLATWLHMRKWTDTANPGRKLPARAANVAGCYRDHFDQDLDEYIVWRVEWTQVAHLGESIWKNDGVIPTQVFTAFAPGIGAGNEGGYVQL